MTGAAKTIDDLPHFKVSAIRQGENRDGGRADSELTGVFDRTEGVNEGRCWLLLPRKDVLIGLSGELGLLEAGTGAAVYQTSEEPMPEVVGLALAYIGPQWAPYHVWMVTEPKWRWDRKLFHALDATARKIEGNGVSIVDGQEVREWIEVKNIGQESHLSRYYPVFPDGRTTLPPIGPDGVIRGGWDHVHCEICDAHIVAESYGYIDPGEHWICEACYGRYIVSHDLSFIKT
jgi:hypothetical protein